jgi:hypothetical protein
MHRGDLVTQILRNARFWIVAWLVSWLAACAPLIGPYSAVAYQNATSLKAETLALMSKATEPYDQHAKEVDKLFVETDKAHEFVKGVPSNSISARQWEVLAGRNGDLMGKFFSRWAQSSTRTLSPVFIDEFKSLVGDGFDEIICLEANKKEATQCASKGGGP